jgi:hypothetical protein
MTFLQKMDLVRVEIRHIPEQHLVVVACAVLARDILCVIYEQLALCTSKGHIGCRSQPSNVSRTSVVHKFFKQQDRKEVIDQGMFRMDLHHLMSNLLAQFVGLLGFLHTT